MVFPRPCHVQHVPSGVTWRRGYRSMRAIVVDGPKAIVSSKRRIPALRDDSILVRPMAIALNPTDWKHIEYGRAADGCIVGCDYAGVVEEVGKSVSRKWQPGDRIFGCSHGANLVNPDDGVFAEYASVKGDLQMRIPDNLSFAHAATIPLGSITVGQGLYQKALGLRLPDVSRVVNQKTSVLIYGGGTSTAALAIQYAKLSGYTVITTCEPGAYDYVKNLGADHTFDYNASNVGEQIRDLTQDHLQYAWDTISNETSARVCADSLSSRLSGLRYGSLNQVTCPREDVQSTTTVMYTAFGKHFKFGEKDIPANKDDYDFGRIFWNLTERLLAAGKIKPHSAKISDTGLDGVLKGLEELRTGKVKGRKLVYNLSAAA